MEISIINSNDVSDLSKYIGEDIQIINIKYRENLHFVQMASFDDNEIFRAFASTRKKAISNTLKAIKKVHS